MLAGKELQVEGRDSGFGVGVIFSQLSELFKCWLLLAAGPDRCTRDCHEGEKQG